jgi:hypothetical protein
MISEGFRESDIIEAIGNGIVLEEYVEEDRCLIAGKYAVSQTISEALHVVVDFWEEGSEIEWIDIVTAYIPRRPFWLTPQQRGGRG